MGNAWRWTWDKPRPPSTSEAYQPWEASEGTIPAPLLGAYTFEGLHLAVDPVH